MVISCGSFELICARLGNYGDVESFVRESTQTALWGTNSSHFSSFWGIELLQQFSSRRATIGVICDRSRGPTIVAAPSGRSVLLGFNSQLGLAILEPELRFVEYWLDSQFHSFLTSGNSVAAIQELGACIFSFEHNRIIDSIETEVVVDAFADGKHLWIEDDLGRQVTIPF